MDRPILICRLADVIFEMRRDVDDQLRLILAGELGWILTSRDEPRVEGRIGGFQVVEEEAIEAHESVLLVEVFEPQPEIQQQVAGVQVHQFKRRGLAQVVPGSLQFYQFRWDGLSQDAGRAGKRAVSGSFWGLKGRAQ